MTTMLYQGYEIFYTSEGQGAPILFLHGLGGSSINWLYQRNFFKQNYQVISIDLPGHGKSEGREELTYFDYHKILKQLIVDELFVKDFLICGISMGGRVAIDFTYHHQHLVKGLVAADTFVGLDQPMREHRKAIYDLLKQPNGEQIWIKRVIEEMGLDPNGSIARGLERGTLSQNLDFIYQLFVELLEYDQRDMLPAITVPTLILHGERDRFIDRATSEEIHEGLANSELVIIPNCGHLPNVEQPKIFNEIVMEFAKKIGL